MYLNKSQVSRLKNTLKRCAFVARSQRERAAYEEGVACLEGASEGYLTNLIPQDHPDRIECVRLILELDL